jgi:mRNA interferase RelE/StbE
VAYHLKFLADAKAEWDKLDGSVQLQFTKVLAKRLEVPRVPKAALAGMTNCYKIKLRTAGYRLVYKVIDEALVLLTVAVGKRDRNAVYNVAMGRLPLAALEKPTKQAVPEAKKSISNKPKPTPKSRFKPKGR